MQWSSYISYYYEYDTVYSNDIEKRYGYMQQACWYGLQISSSVNDPVNVL